MKKQTNNNYHRLLASFPDRDRKHFLRAKTPAKVQDLLNRIPYNFETKGETCKSPLMVMKTKSAHCMEGAFLAVYVLGLHGIKGRLVHLMAERPDDDHMIAVYKDKNLWGALSKTNHGVLRYREPVYASVRELVMSYFHEYFLNSNGKKTLHSYSLPFSLAKFGTSWITELEDLWKIDKEIDKVKHFSIVPPHMKKRLRKAEKIERKMGTIVEWKK